MKKSLNHLPARKRTAVRKIVRYIRDEVDPEMIILFGSHARGDWVEDTYMEGQVTYEYVSDYDVLLITANEKYAGQHQRWRSVENRVWGHISDRPMVKGTLLNLIVHDIAHVNKMLSEGRYFFTDIKREGILLFDSKRYKLEAARELSPEDRQRIAKEDYKLWYESANDFLIDSGHAMARGSHRNAAFYLHQATERFYGTILMVFTYYRPKMHDIEKLGQRASSQDVRFMQAFPRATDEQDECFKLLKRAYIDARYDPKFTITEKQLKYLARRVRKLKTLTRTICREKIKSFLAPGG